jgi:hypothetical protein
MLRVRRGTCIWCGYDSEWNHRCSIWNGPTEWNDDYYVCDQCDDVYDYLRELEW